MAKKLHMQNGTVTSGGSNLCDDCGAPVHPSLDCRRCGGGSW